MSARAWVRRRNKWRLRPLHPVVIDIALFKQVNERKQFNDALGWWLDRPHLTYEPIK